MKKRFGSEKEALTYLHRKVEINLTEKKQIKASDLGIKMWGIIDYICKPKEQGYDRRIRSIVDFNV